MYGTDTSDLITNDLDELEEGAAIPLIDPLEDDGDPEEDDKEPLEDDLVGDLGLEEEL